LPVRAQFEQCFPKRPAATPRPNGIIHGKFAAEYLPASPRQQRPCNRHPGTCCSMESVKHSETLSLSYAAVRTPNTEKLIELFINLLLIMDFPRCLFFPTVYCVSRQNK
jgi:hypothetical protein